MEDSFLESTACHHPESVDGFRMVIVANDPPIFRLTRDDWGGRWINLKSRQLLSFRAVDSVVLRTFCNVLQDCDQRRWEEIISELLKIAPKLPADAANYMHVPAIMARCIVTAEATTSRFATFEDWATAGSIGDIDRDSGMMTLTSGASVVAFNRLFLFIKRKKRTSKVTRGKLSKFLRDVGGHRYTPVFTDGLRWPVWLLSKVAMKKLVALSGGMPR